MRLVRGFVSGQLASMMLPGTFLFFKRKTMVCFASPLVSIWLVCIQEEIRHSFIHSVALRLPFSQTRRSCVQQQLRNVAFFKKKKNLFNTLWYVLLHSEQPSPTCTLLTARVQLHFLKFFVMFSFSHIYTIYRTLLFFKTGNADKTSSTRRRISWMMRFQRRLSIAVTLCQQLPQTATL